MEICEIVRALREDNDLTQTEVAKVLGIKQQQYSIYERGEQELPTRHIKNLALFYNISADYILNLPNNLKYPER